MNFYLKKKKKKKETMIYTWKRVELERKRGQRMEYPFQNAIEWNFCFVDDRKNLIIIRLI